MNTQSIFNILSRNEELYSLRKGTILKECNIQKKEFYRILKTVQSFDKLSTPARKP